MIKNFLKYGFLDKEGIKINLKDLQNIIIKNKIEFIFLSLSLIVFLSNIFCFIQADQGYFSYIAQELLRGYPIFSTTIAIKPPLVYFLDAFLMKLFFFLPEYLAVRVGMLLLGSISMVLFYKLLKIITNNSIIPIFSVLIILSFPYFVQNFLNSGVKPIILFLLFLEFLLLFKKKYLLSSVFASLCFMTWQPGGVLIFGPIIYCFLNKERTKKYFKIMIGFSLPLILIILYFFFNGLLNKFIEYNFILPVTYKAQIFELFKWLKIAGILGFYNTELLFILFSIIGISMALFIILKKMKNKEISLYIKQNKGLFSFMIPFFLLFLYSIYDFQGADDLIILLPPISILAALFLTKTSKKIPLLLVLCFIILYGFLPYLQPLYPENPLITAMKKVDNIGGMFEVARNYSVPELTYLSFFQRKGDEMTLEQQIEIAEYIKNNTDEDEKIFSLGAPELLLLSNRRNTNDYFFLNMELYANYAEETGIADELRRDMIEETPKFIVSRNVPMNKDAIDFLHIEKYLEVNYTIDTYPEYVIWERKK